MKLISIKSLACAGYLWYQPAMSVCENTSFCLLFLADSSKEEYIAKAFNCLSSQRGTATVRRILTFVTCMTRFCLQLLHHRFLAWAKPDTTSLVQGILTDLARSKSDLAPENPLLRQQLIILRRQVKRHACTKTDRMPLELLARMLRS